MAGQSDKDVISKAYGLLQLRCDAIGKIYYSCNTDLICKNILLKISFLAQSMSSPVHHIIRGHTFWLSPQRCIYWEDMQALIVSDLHIGKTGHFRKQGIAVPQAVYKEDLQRLFSEIEYYKAKQLIIVGDLFHSKENRELQLFVKWRNDIPYVDVHLVKGNHDILKDEWYLDANISLSQEQLCMGEFIFTHDVATVNCTDKSNPYIFSGHIHPAVSISGIGRQSLTFPCYFFGNNYAVLPAFSKFTGVYVMKRNKGDKVFAIVNQTVMTV